MQKKRLGRKKSSVCSSDFCSAGCQTQCWRFVMCQRGTWRLGVRWVGLPSVTCIARVSRTVVQVCLTSELQTWGYVSPAYFCLYFLRTETSCVMIMPLSFPGIDTVTKFKLRSCPENVSFMCVYIHKHLFLSIWFWNFGATQGSPLACSRHVHLIFFTPEPIPTPPPFFVLFWKFLKVQAYLVMFCDLDFFVYFFMIELDFFGKSDVCFLSLVHIMPLGSLVMLNSNTQGDVCDWHLLRVRCDLGPMSGIFGHSTLHVHSCVLFFFFLK